MRLLDHYIPLFAYTAELLRDPFDPAYAIREVEEKLERLIAEAKAGSLRAGIAPASAESALFAVLAWIDEALLESTWPGKNQWKHIPLQDRHFNTRQAGEEFFERLDRLRPEDRELKEVYYYCLALRFMGRYFRSDDRRRLEEIIRAQLKDLTGQEEPQVSEQLFPEAYSGEVGSPVRRPRFTVVHALFSLPVAVFLLGYLVYTLILNSTLLSPPGP
ncbi:MAG: DotU family type IV/VI secretion system protein [Candidatus Zixiibacteriota bacterium]|nr:MAG: DotU family type IV/VI secretion system protein [candidate division Zixibacteria bacterium]